jgi:xylan 1,4-beta-xylosidase
MMAISKKVTATFSSSPGQKVAVAFFAIVALAAGVALAAEPVAVETITVDFARTAGRIKAIHGVNNGPLTRGNNADLEPWWKKAGFPTARLHDCHWPSPDVVDVSTIFPLSHLDPDDERNYLFAKTDDYLAAILRCGSKVIYRLGQSIERHGVHFFTHPPRDMDAYAKVCVNIVRHYNDGWAKGFRHGIEYWEIWNEPDLGRGMWSGTQEEYCTLYEKVARAIHAHDAKLKIGGPALTQRAFEEKGWGRPFLDRCKERHLPLDFFSVHAYVTEPNQIAELVRTARRELDARGFTKTEIHLNEWRYAPGWGDLSPKRREDWSTVPAFFKRATGGKGAAYAAAVLIRMQEEPVDMMNFYTADDSPWSMFGTFGIRTPVYHAFVAFNEVAKRPARAPCTVAADGGRRSAVVAGLADDGHSAVVLMTTFEAAAGRRACRIAGLPWGAEARVEALLVDGDHALEPVLPQVSPAADGVAITVDLPADAVCLVRLVRP